MTPIINYDTVRDVKGLMQLSEVIKKFCVGHMYPSKLKQVLMGEHPTVRIRKVQNGTILMSQGITVKCIIEYYENPIGKKIKKNMKNIIERCRTIRKDFDLLYSCSDLDCQACHLACLNAVEDNRLQRKKQKRSK